MRWCYIFRNIKLCIWNDKVDELFWSLDEDIVECFDFEQMNQVVVVALWGHFEGLRVFQVSKMC